MPVPNIAADFANILNQDTPPPRGGADMAMLLQDARRYKTANNKQEWKNSLDQFQIKSDQAKLAQDEKHFKDNQKVQKELTALSAKYSKLENDNANEKWQQDIQTQSIKLWDEGKHEAAYRLSIHALKDNPDAIKQMGIMFAYKMLKDPQWKQWALAQGAGMDKETMGLFIYDTIIRPDMEEVESPGIKAGDSFDPHATDADNISAIEHLQQFKPIEEFKPIGNTTSTPKMPQQGANGKQGDGWSTTKFMDYTTGMLGNEASANLQGRAAGEQDLLTPEEQQAAARRQAGLIPKEGTEGTEDPDMLKTIQGILELEGVDQTIIDQMLQGVTGYKAPGSTTSSTAKDPDEVAISKYIRQLYPNDLEKVERIEAKLFSAAGADGAATEEERFEEEIDNLSPEDKGLIATLRGTDASVGGVLNIRTLPRDFKNFDELVEDGTMTEAEGEKAKTRRTEITVRTQLPTQLQNELVGSERMLSFLNRTLEYIEENPDFIDEDGNWNRNHTNFLNSMGRKFYNLFGVQWGGDIDQLHADFQLQLANFIRSISGTAASEREVGRLKDVYPETKNLPALNLSKIRALRIAFGDFLKAVYVPTVGDTYAGRIQRDIAYRTLSDTQKVRFDANNFAQENPNATSQDIQEYLESTIPGTLNEKDKGVIGEFVNEMFGESYTKIKTYIQDNTDDIDTIYRKVAEELKTNGNIEDSLASLKDQVTTAFNSAREGTSEISQNSIDYVHNLKVLEGIATQHTKSSEFIEAATKNISEDVRIAQGWTDQKLMEMWNKANGVTDGR